MKLDPSKARILIGGKEISPFDADIKIEIPLTPAIVSQLKTILAESNDPFEAVEQAFRLGCQYVINVDVQQKKGDA
jgi:hypothetical protein